MQKTLSTGVATLLKRPAARRLAWIITGIVLATGVVGGVGRAQRDEPDWRAFRNETQYAWDHRAIRPGTKMFGYLPATVVALWPFTVWCPQPAGAMAFVTFNVLLTLASIALLRRWQHGGRRPTVAAAGFVWPIFLTVSHLQHVLQANQLTIWVLCLWLAGGSLVFRRRSGWGGFLLGAAGCIKLTPFLFALYFAWRRDWRGIGGMIVAVMLLDVAPSVLSFGWDGALREHRMWRQRVAWYANQHFIEDPYLRVRRHGANASYGAVLTRWLRGPPDADWQVELNGSPPPEVVQRIRSELGPREHLTLDPMPPPDAEWNVTRFNLAHLPRRHLTDLSPRAVWWIWASSLALMMTALCAATYCAGGSSQPARAQAAEASLWLLATFFLSPMMRDYYLALAIPAYVVVWAAVAHSRSGGGGGTHRLGRGAACVALFVFFLGVPGLAWRTGAWYGFHLATVTVLAMATAWAWRTSLSTTGAADQSAATTLSD